jgi:hypothetical protein
VDVGGVLRFGGRASNIGLEGWKVPGWDDFLLLWSDESGELK